jgi:transcriptional regulator with XRE-family HTH domain
MADLMTLGSRIRQLRQRLGMSQVELAGNDLSPSYISLLEAGKRSPTPQVLTRLARRLQCEPAYLLTCVEQDRREDLSLELRYAQLSLASGEAAEAQGRFRAVAERASGQELADLRAQAEWGEARALEAQGRLEAALSAYEKLRESAHQSRGQVSWLEVVVALCRCYKELGDISRGVELGEAALAELQSLHIVPAPAGIELISTLVGLYYERGDLHRAAYLAETAIEQAEAMGDRQARGAAYWNASIVAHEGGRTGDALMLAERALALYAEGENERALAKLRGVYAALLLRAEPPQPARARPMLESGIEQLTEQGQSVDAAYLETELARAHLQLGDSTAAVSHAEQALALLGSEHRLESARALIVLAAARIKQGQRDAATEAYERAAVWLEASEALRQAAFAWAELAEVFEALKDERRALWAYRQSVKRLGFRGSPPAEQPVSTDGSNAVPLPG